MSKVFIYGLVDPFTRHIRYVGKSIDIKTRYKRHILYEIKSNTHKTKWILSLKAKGMFPEIIILQETDNENWEDRERYWISFLKEMGETLTNGTEGGDGRTRGFKHPKSACEKISQALKSRPKEMVKAIGEKISQRLKGRSLTEENKQELSKSHIKYWQSIDTTERNKRIKNLNHGWKKESRDKISKTFGGTKREKSTSKFRGVSWFKRDSCWRAWIYVDKKQIHLGYFIDDKMAAKAYNEAIIKYEKPLSYLNIIPE